MSDSTHPAGDPGNVRTTNLGYAILGLLAARPMSGYDIARLLKEPVSFFWSANHSQIYPELARLEAAGLVEYQVIEQYDRPAKKLHTITPAGLDAVKHWVTTPIKPQPSRSELVLKTFFIWLADPAQAVELFREQERVHAAQLQRHEQVLAKMEADGADRAGLHSPEFGNYLTLLRGVSYEREYTLWCRTVAEKLEAAIADERSK
jgi:DNA-binding PadR family transcriptional regulator